MQVGDGGAGFGPGGASWTAIVVGIVVVIVEVVLVLLVVACIFLLRDQYSFYPSMCLVVVAVVEVAVVSYSTMCTHSCYHVIGRIVHCLDIDLVFVLRSVLHVFVEECLSYIHLNVIWEKHKEQHTVRMWNNRQKWSKANILHRSQIQGKKHKLVCLFERATKRLNRWRLRL